MKRITLCVAVTAMMMTACQKDEELSKDTFTATTESTAKTHLDGLNLKWDDEGESIMVVGYNNNSYVGHAEYFATSVTNAGTCATFASREGEEVNAGEYIIFYPASVAPSTTSPCRLPAVQEYAENSMKGFPMYAETQSHTFQFTNLCGIFRLQLQKAGVNVRRITITADNPLHGVCWPFPTTDGKTYFAATDNTEDAKTITLDCGETGVNIDNLTDFNIYLPVGTYGTFDITIETTDGRYCTKNLNYNTSIAINRNERVTLVREGANLVFATPAPDGVINGLFTVDEDGKKVYFSKGNLQNINGTWRFADHQYDCLNAYSPTAWDLFGWSTGYSNFSMNASTNGYDYSNNFLDWGYVAENTQGWTTRWHTLSADQWIYLLSSRTNASSKRGCGTVNEVHGMILLPDTWTTPTGLTFTSGFGSWTRNSYTADQWKYMEAAGAVFLPAAGQRHGTAVSNAGTFGKYWSSLYYSNGGYRAWGIYFDNSALDDFVSFMDLSYGYSVRLVQDQ